MNDNNFGKGVADRVDSVLSQTPETFLNNAFSAVGNQLGDLGNGAVDVAKGLFGTIYTGITGIWDGGFIGFAEGAEAELKDWINAYCDKIEHQIEEFNKLKGSVNEAYRGTDVVSAVEEFINRCKETLLTMVTALRGQVKLVDKAFEQWQAGNASATSAVQSGSSDIQQMASNINLD